MFHWAQVLAAALFWRLLEHLTSSNEVSVVEIAYWKMLVTSCLCLPYAFLTEGSIGWLYRWQTPKKPWVVLQISALTEWVIHVSSGWNDCLHVYVYRFIYIYIIFYILYFIYYIYMYIYITYIYITLYYICIYILYIIYYIIYIYIILYYILYFNIIYYIHTFMYIHIYIYIYSYMI